MALRRAEPTASVCEALASQKRVEPKRRRDPSFQREAAAPGEDALVKVGQSGAEVQPCVGSKPWVSRRDLAS